MLIPPGVARIVERQLRSRYILVARAQQRLYEAQQRAVSIAGPPTDNVSVQSSGQKSRVEMAVVRILKAEEALDEARKKAAHAMLDGLVAQQDAENEKYKQEHPEIFRT